MTYQILLGVTEAIAEVKGVDPIDLDIALEDHISVDSIQGLVNHDSRSWAISFEIPHHLVTVTGSGWVLVDNERILRWEPHDNRGEEEALLRNSAAISGD